MNIKKIFEHQPLRLLNIYVTAGFPKLNSLEKILPALEKGGVDIVEIGMPYSDPLSDGPTIQESSTQAIKNGITTDLIFEQIKHIDSNIPLLLMGYFNTVYQYGVEKFCEKCKDMGISGLIIPDLPIDIYLNKYKKAFESNNISNIFLVTPETSKERIKLIDKLSSSFIYAVSSSSTTGKNKKIQESKNYLARLHSMNLKSPIMVGFNICSKDDFEFVSKYSAGAIIGSAFIQKIKGSRHLEKDTMDFIENIKY